MSALKWIFFVFLVFTNSAQFYLYRKVKQRWERMPVVAAIITKSALRDYNDLNGNRVYEADIRFEYQFRGNSYESVTPSLEGPALGPRWNYATELVDRYAVGEMYNARVIPEQPDVAYLEVASLNKVAVVLVPALTVAYGLYLFGIVWFSFDS